MGGVGAVVEPGWVSLVVNHKEEGMEGGTYAWARRRLPVVVRARERRVIFGGLWLDVSDDGWRDKVM